MKLMTIVGIVFIVIGVVALAYQGISYTTREPIAYIGPVEVAKETRRTLPLPPLLGGLALVGGIVLVIVGAKR